MVSTLDIFSRQHIGDSLFFSNKHLTFGNNLHEMSFCFLGKNTKMFKLSAETKINIQRFEIFFLFFPENKKPVFLGGQYQLVIVCGISPESEKG